MRILAVSDVHSPRFFGEFVGSLENCAAPDIFLMAGDMVNRGTVSEFPRVLDAIDDTLGHEFPVVSCFGNEEYSEVRDHIVSEVGHRVVFLDEKAQNFEIDGLTIGIAGTQGSLDRPTEWQRRNLPNIKGVFERRAHRAESLLKKMSDKVDRRILLMHYSPCIETCVGEDQRTFAWLGSRKFYAVVKKEQPDLVIHGHVHNAIVHEFRIDSTVVRNVSFPAVRSVTQLELWSRAVPQAQDIEIPEPPSTTTRNV